MITIVSAIIIKPVMQINKIATKTGNVFKYLIFSDTIPQTTTSIMIKSYILQLIIVIAVLNNWAINIWRKCISHNCRWGGENLVYNRYRHESILAIPSLRWLELKVQLSDKLSFFDLLIISILVYSYLWWFRSILKTPFFCRRWGFKYSHGPIGFASPGYPGFALIGNMLILLVFQNVKRIVGKLSAMRPRTINYKQISHWFDLFF